MVGNPLTWWLTMVATFGPLIGTLVFVVLTFVAISFLARLLQFLADHVFL